MFGPFWVQKNLIIESGFVKFVAIWQEMQGQITQFWSENARSFPVFINIDIISSLVFSKFCKSV